MDKSQQSDFPCRVFLCKKLVRPYRLYYNQKEQTVPEYCYISVKKKNPSAKTTRMDGYDTYQKFTDYSNLRKTPEMCI